MSIITTATKPEGHAAAAHPAPAAGHGHSMLAHHFANMEQQHETGILGMWMFLSTEILFFGGAFGAYATYRYLFPEAFIAGSAHLDIKLGCLNTAILLASSFTMVMAVWCTQTRRPASQTALWLVATIVLGLAFLGVKSMEWKHDYDLGMIPGVRWEPVRYVNGKPPPGLHTEGDGGHHGPVDWLAGDPKHGVPPAEPGHVQIFFVLYFCMTSLHALHMIIGFGIIAVVAVLAWRGRYSPEFYTPIEVTGLYWHFVDIVWIFLFPLFYLISHSH